MNNVYNVKKNVTDATGSDLLPKKGVMKIFSINYVINLYSFRAGVFLIYTGDIID